MDNMAKYREIFCETFNVNESELGEEFTFKSVKQWDSVAHLTLISELEDAFDIMFDAEDILHFESYLNGIKILKKYGVEIE